LSFAANFAMPEDKVSSIIDVGWQIIDVEEDNGFSPGIVQYYKVDENTPLTKSVQQSVCSSQQFLADTYLKLRTLTAV
jgi:hypothetical protein